ncbi:MAG: membrane protein insertion efficiency factor YidD [Chlamydia sp.]
MESTSRANIPTRKFSSLASWIQGVYLLFFFTGSLSSAPIGAYEKPFLNKEPFDPILREKEIENRSSLLLQPSRLSSWIIAFHQQVLSSTDGPRSHFYPTSSDYMKRALQAHGAVGYLLGMDRLLRENGDDWIYPMIKIGSSLRKYDPIPKRIF